MKHFTKSLTVLLHAIAITALLSNLSMGEKNSQLNQQTIPSQLYFQTKTVATTSL
ncbi:MAG: hypothetical protein HC810_03775 [Acaryochloridaceae cyanobacterium RL_2_7]|nr:hypothetical protein [Acaryochloridaceae cyanobacterium RL_2_7]